MIIADDGNSETNRLSSGYNRGITIKEGLDLKLLEKQYYLERLTSVNGMLLAEDFFAWTKGILKSNRFLKGKTLEGLNYCVNQTAKR